MSVQPVANAFVARHDDLREEVEGDDGAVLEADVLPAAGIVEVDFAEHLIEEVLGQHAGRLHHVFEHLRVVEDRQGDALEGEHVADASHQRTAEDPEGVVAAGRVGPADGVGIDFAVRVVAVEAQRFLAFPVIGGNDRGPQVARDGVVAVLRDLFIEAVAIDDGAAGRGLGDLLRLERRVHPGVAAEVADAVEVEEDVRLAVVADAVLDEQVPLPEVLVPVAELHVEAAVRALVVHLPVEAFPVRHGAAPLGSAGRDGHAGELLRLGRAARAQTASPWPEPPSRRVETV